MYFYITSMGFLFSDLILIVYASNLVDDKMS